MDKLKYFAVNCIKHEPLMCITKDSLLLHKHVHVHVLWYTIINYRNSY